MKKRRKSIELLISLSIAAILLLLIYSNITLALTFENKNQGDFNNGTYLNTTYNGSSVILSGTNLTGVYTSQIFDAGALSIWNNITLQKEMPQKEELFTVDVASDVWQSENSGINWTLVKNDFNGAVGNNADDIAINSSNALFILDRQDLWYSNNSGIDWALVNDNYNGADTQDGVALAIDNNNSIFIIEGDEDVWQSNNSGVNFTKIAANFNAGNANVAGLTINSSNVLFTVDVASDVWQSNNSGINWTLIKDDFNGAVGNNADDIAVNSSNVLFILDRQDLWYSNNSGVDWTLVNDDYNGAEAQNGVSLAIDLNNSIFIIEGDEDVWKSNNSGVNFTKISTNFNAGNANVAGLSSILYKTNLTYQLRNCSSSNCADGSFIGPDGTASTYFTSANQDINLTSRYLQYKFFFTSQKENLTASLSNVTIDYALLDSVSPLITIVEPQNTSYAATSLSINFTIIDDNIQSCWYTNNSGATNITISSCANTTYTASQGSTTLTLHASDIAGNKNSSSVTFFVDSIYPSINITYPKNTTYNINVSSLNYTVSDSNLQACWYSLNLGVTNTTIACGANITGLTSTEGSNTWRVYVNDFTGNLNLSSVTFFKDTIAPGISITSPTNISYNNKTHLVNISTSGANTVLFFNGTANVTYTAPIYMIFSEGTNIAIAYANDTIGNTNQTSLTFFVDSIPPAINITSPSNGSIFGANTSLSLNFTAIDTNLQSCWYNIDSTANISLSNCANATFNTSEGSHELFVFANDTLGNAGSKTINFSVTLGPPIISQNSPANNSYLNSSLVQFSYSPTDIDLNSCELWGNFTGVFSKNQTNSTILSGQQGIFTLNLSDNAYKWNIKCNDTAGNSAFRTNRTFHVDTKAPRIVLSEPAGEKSSASGITLVFTANDSSPISCIYNVFLGASPIITNTTISCSESTSFNVPSDSSYVLNFYINDSAGNRNNTNINFSVNTPSSGSSGGNSGSQSGGSVVIPSLISSNSSRNLRIGITNLQEIAIKRGTNADVEMEVINREGTFLNHCSIETQGSESSWITNSQNKGLSSGEKFQFILHISIPNTIEPGEYNPQIKIKCDEGEREAAIKMVVFRNSFEVVITNYERTPNTLKLFYHAEEFAKEYHNITIDYALSDLQGKVIASGKTTTTILAGYSGEGTLEIDLPRDVEGEYNLKMTLSDEKNSAEIEKKVVVYRSDILGLAISDSNRKTISVIVIIIAAAVAMFFIGQFLYKKYNNIKTKKLTSHIETKFGNRVIKLDIKPK